MDTDSLKRLLLFCLVVAGLLICAHRAQAAEHELAMPDSLVITAFEATQPPEKRPESRQRKPQFRARLLRHWWQPRIMAATPSRRPTITRII